MNSVLQAIGKQILTARIMHGMTQEQFAKEIHVTPTYISALERGRKEPSIKLLYQIAAVSKRKLLIMLPY